LLIALSTAFAADKKASAGATSGASSEGLRVPVLGFVAKPDGAELRPVMGALGAAVLGDSVTLQDSVIRMNVSPAGSFALATRSDSQPLSVVPIDEAGTGAMQPITGAFPQYDAIEFSASGFTAALYSAANQRIQIVTGLPDSPALSQDLDVSSLGAPVFSIAVADDASIVLVGTSDGQSGAVYRITPDNVTVNILTAAVPSALRLIPQTDSALIADSQVNQVLLVSTLSGTPSVKALAGPDDGASGPDRIELLAGNRLAVVANLSASSVLFIDLQLAKSTSVPINAPAISLKPIKLRTGLAIVTAAPAAYWLVSNGPDGPVISLIADLAAIAGNQ
jgi:hypothetical protein